MKKLTGKEEEIMGFFWQEGPLFANKGPSCQKKPMISSSFPVNFFITIIFVQINYIFSLLTTIHS